MTRGKIKGFLFETANPASMAGRVFGVSAVFLLIGACVCGGEVYAEDFKGGIDGYELVGIIEGDTEDAGAIFENRSTKKQRLFHIGDVIDNGTLMEIGRGGVFIRRGEQRIRIRVGLGTPEVGGAGNPVQIPGEIQDPTKALTQVLSQEVPPYDPALEKAPVSKRDLSLLIEGIQKGLEEDSVWIATPFGSSLTLANLDPGVLGRLGLDRGDVIVGISGMGFESPERVSEILSILNRARVFNLSVLRDKVVLPLYYSVS